ncbi:hypothetical protein AN960_13135 [Bacillus sp. FJAT-25509]|uniref:hypothetical protein n=1 Tax=Bacillus sp. FJAT-25509 TaxID=1712029 RepID=UPI0006F56539|nr:hypothetical protein [Bacillus sp. FJAT-25509]KQL38289.1 hypothetical protein AN960_13135 [Bacillus sp. FJAT-25509]
MYFNQKFAEHLGIIKKSVKFDHQMTAMQMFNHNMKYGFEEAMTRLKNECEHFDEEYPKLAPSFEPKNYL